MTTYHTCDTSRDTVKRVTVGKHLRYLLFVCTGAMAIIAITGGVAVYKFGSVAASVQYLNGERLLIDPQVADLGPLVTGESRRFAITISNLSDRPVRIVGGNADCSCIRISGLPVNIPGGDSGSVRVDAVAVDSRGAGSGELDVSKRLVLFTDAPESSRLAASVKWRQTTRVATRE